MMRHPARSMRPRSSRSWSQCALRDLASTTRLDRDAALASPMLMSGESSGKHYGSRSDRPSSVNSATAPAAVAPVSPPISAVRVADGRLLAKACFVFLSRLTYPLQFLENIFRSGLPIDRADVRLHLRSLCRFAGAAMPSSLSRWSEIRRSRSIVRQSPAMALG